MDEYEPTTKTVFQSHGATAHCKQTVLRKQNNKSKNKAAGYTVVVAWECNEP